MLVYNDIIQLNVHVKHAAFVAMHQTLYQSKETPFRPFGTNISVPLTELEKIHATQLIRNHAAPILSNGMFMHQYQPKNSLPDQTAFGKGLHLVEERVRDRENLQSELQFLRIRRPAAPALIHPSILPTAKIA
jgi:hypothetical protein